MVFEIFEANSTAKRCVLPGDIQGRYSDDMKVSNMLFLISIYSSEGVADFNPSWWYEDIWHVIPNVNI